MPQDPDEGPSRLGGGDLSEVIADFRQRDQPLALGEAQKASALSPDWELAAIFEAELLQRSSAEAAEARLADFLAKHPDSREVRLAYARLLVTQQRYAEARDQFEKLLAQHPKDKDVIFAVGLLAAQLKDYATAESNLEKLLALGYRDPNGVRYALGQVEEEQKKWPEAINWYEQIGPGQQYIPARVRVAEVLAKEGKLSEARDYLHNVKASDEGQRAELVIAEAQLLREAGRYQEAFDVLAKALEANPEQPDLLYDYALAADKIGRYNLVESSLRELIKLRPDYAHAYNALGYSLADDLLSGMGLAIGYGVALSIPFVGADIASLIWGGPFPGSGDFRPRIDIAAVLLLPVLMLTRRRLLAG